MRDKNDIQVQKLDPGELTLGGAQLRSTVLTGDILGPVDGPQESWLYSCFTFLLPKHSPRSFFNNL